MAHMPASYVIIINTAIYYWKLKSRVKGSIKHSRLIPEELPRSMSIWRQVDSMRDSRNDLQLRIYACIPQPQRIVNAFVTECIASRHGCMYWSMI